MEKIHVIHVSTATSWRGGEQQLAYLIQGLSTRDVKHEVLCAENTPIARYCQDHQISPITFKKRGSLNLAAARLLTRICREKNLIIHCHDSHAHNIAYFAALVFRNRAPVIVHRRVDFPVSRSFFSKAKYNHPRIKKYICVSEAIRNILIPSLHDPGKAIVIHSGINLERFSKIEHRNILRNEFGLSDDTVLIGNVSALAPHKDYFTFIGTAEILLKNNPLLRLVIIGDGPEKQDIQNEIKRRNLEGEILMAGFRKNIPELLKELNVLLLTSKTEGLGTTILDAFASGLPVVATKTGGIPEIVEHMATGLLAEVGNAGHLAQMVETLLNDEDLKNKLLSNAKNKVKEFDYQITATKTLNVYREIAAGRISE